MGRPHVKVEEKRVVQVNIRLTADEFKKVSEYAAASGLSSANWIRKKIFTGKFPAMKESPIDTATYRS
jgi:predicted DNA binding CopG/RHH family protein